MSTLNEQETKDETTLDKDEGEQPTGLAKYTDDLKELRNRLFIIVGVFIVSMIAGLALTTKLMPLIIEYSPAKDLALNSFSPWDAISVFVKFGTVFATVIGLPVILFQIWRFISPALTKRERRVSLKYIPFAVICFLTGFAFAYFIVFPMAFQFSTNLTKAMGLQATYGVAEFFSYMSDIILFISFAFELPVVVMFLTGIKIIKPAYLLKCRKVAYVVLTVVGTAITPPDVISDILVLFPLIGLFEFSILLSKVVYRKLLRVEKEAELED